MIIELDPQRNSLPATYARSNSDVDLEIVRSPFWNFVPAQIDRHTGPQSGDVSRLAQLRATVPDLDLVDLSAPCCAQILHSRGSDGYSVRRITRDANLLNKDAIRRVEVSCSNVLIGKTR